MVDQSAENGLPADPARSAADGPYEPFRISVHPGSLGSSEQHVYTGCGERATGSAPGQHRKLTQTND